MSVIRCYQQVIGNLLHPVGVLAVMRTTNGILAACLACLIAVATCWGQEYGTISGTVTGVDRAAVSGATVTAHYVCTKPCVLAMIMPQVKTDNAGHYKFEKLQYARWSVSAAKPEDNYPPVYISFYSVERQPEVELSAANRDITVDIKLAKKAGVLVGTVEDADTGLPLDANVEFRTNDPKRVLGGSGLTNARFRVLVPSNTPVSMRVYKDGYEDWFFTRNGAVVPIQLQPDEELPLQIKLKKRGSSDGSAK